MLITLRNKVDEKFTILGVISIYSVDSNILLLSKDDQQYVGKFLEDSNYGESAKYRSSKSKIEVELEVSNMLIDKDTKNIVKIFGIYDVINKFNFKGITIKENTKCILMEYLSPLKSSNEYIKNIVRNGIYELYEKTGYYHCDIKLNNIGISDNVIKIFDFGYCSNGDKFKYKFEKYKYWQTNSNECTPEEVTLYGLNTL